MNLPESSAPLCPRCDTPLIPDTEGVTVYPPVPGWACTHCVTVIDLTKLNLP